MKFRTLLRHIKESFKSIGRNGWMTFASVSAVTVTLLLVGVFVVMMLNLNHIASNIESDVEVRVHIDQTATPEDQDKLKQELEGLSHVQKVMYSSKDKELDSMIENMGENGEAFRLFEQDNPLNDVFVIKTDAPEYVIPIAEDVEKMHNVHKVQYGQGFVEKLFNVVKTSRTIGIVLVAALLLTAMFLISNTIKITIFARRREIEIMRLVGATNGFIRWPFFLEGLWLGIMGSIIPILVIAFGYRYLYSFAAPSSIEYIKLLPYQPFIFEISGLLILFGALIGIWGSLMSVRKFLKA